MAKSAAERAIDLIAGRVDALAEEPKQPLSLFELTTFFYDPDTYVKTVQDIEYLLAQLAHYYDYFQDTLRVMVEQYNHKCLVDGEPPLQTIKYGELSLDELEFWQLAKPFTSENYQMAFNATLFNFMMENLWQFRATSWQDLANAFYAIQVELLEAEEINPNDKQVLKEVIEGLKSLLGGAPAIMMYTPSREGFDARYTGTKDYFVSLEKKIRMARGVSLTEDQERLLHGLRSSALSRSQMIAILKVANEVEEVSPAYGLVAGESMTLENAVAFSQLFWTKIEEALGSDFMLTFHYEPLEERKRVLTEKQNGIRLQLEGMRGINQVDDGIVKLQEIVSHLSAEHLGIVHEAIAAFSNNMAKANRQRPPLFKRSVSDEDRQRITTDFWKSIELLMLSLLPVKNSELREKIEKILLAITYSKQTNRPE